MPPDVKLYIRGFFGSKKYSTEALVQKRYTPVRSVFDLSPEALQHVVMNEAIIEIYNQVVGRRVMHTKFDYRERVIQTALRAFGLDNFLVWAELNLESPTFSQLHADFITDTMRFIVTGKRDIPVDSWERMINQSANDPINKPCYNPEVMRSFIEYFNNSINWNRNSLGNYANTVVINRWLSHPTGFSDLVVSLYILFGDRSAT